jgi:hypothetical protein
MEDKPESFDKEKYKMALKNIVDTASRLLPKIRALLIEFAYVEIVLEGKKGRLHKTIPEGPTKEVLELANRKFMAILVAYLNAREDNYSIYNAMVLPALSIDDYSSQKDPALPKTSL